MLLALALLPACLPELPEDKTSVEGEHAGDCSDAADNDLDGTFDCEDDGCAASPDCASVAAPPEGVAVAITPAAPEDEDDLRCAVTTEAVDPNGDAVSYAFAWTVDGEDAGLSTDTVSASFTSVGQSWTCTVTPSDGTLTGTPAMATVTIAQGNRAPSAPAVAITPAEPTDDDALTCAVVTESVDPDGDVVTYAYRWTVDGVDAGVSVASVPAERTLPGESWTCSVTATDGTATSEAGTAIAEVGACEATVGALHVGTGGALVAEASSAWGPGQITVEWWQRTNDHRLVNESGIGTAYDDVYTGGWYCATFDADGTTQLSGKLRYGDASAGIGIDTGITDSGWHHFACTYDGTVLNLWVDGLLMGTHSYGRGLEYTNQPLTVFNRNKWFAGGIKDYDVRAVRISDAALYSAGFLPEWSPEPAATTVAYWRLEGAGGASYRDEVGGVAASPNGDLSWTTTGTYCP